MSDACSNATRCKKKKNRKGTKRYNTGRLEETITCLNFLWATLRGWYPLFGKRERSGITSVDRIRRWLYMCCLYAYVVF